MGEGRAPGFVHTYAERLAVATYAVAVDLGGTNLRVAAIDEHGHIVSRLKLPTSVEKGKDSLFSNLVNGIHEMYKRCPRDAIKGVGLGVAGAIDIRKGTVTHAPNVPGWEHYPLKDHVLTCLPKGSAVVLENDANAAAVGELWKGAGIGVQDLVCITLGTGVGGGIIVEGKLVHGADGMAGEVGHITVDPNGPLCNCGNYGCLEALASATAIGREAVKAFGTHAGEKLWGAVKGNHETITAEMVYHLAESGDSASLSIYQAMGRYLGIGIASLINIFNPEMVIIGGGVSKAWKLFITATEEEVRKRAFSIPAQRAKLVPAGCGDDAALLGAAHLVFSRDS